MLIAIKKRSYKDITQCLICNTTLGADSRDTYSVFCHDHMNCIKCGERVTPIEAQTCYDRFLESLDSEEGETEETTSKEHVEVMHARCYSLSREATITITQSELDTLNQIRLMVTPDMSIGVIANENKAKIQSMQLISNMSIDQMRMHLCMIESCAAWVRNTIKQNPEYRKEDDRKLEKERFNPPKTNTTNGVLANTNLQATPVGLNKEVVLARFMESHGLTDRATAKGLLSALNKGTRSIIASLKLPEDKAQEMALKLMIESGQLPH